MSNEASPPRPGLAAYLPEFETPGFVFANWTGRMSPTAQAFMRDATDLGWVRGDVDWRAWIETPEASTLRDDPAALAHADRDQLSKLLTALIRMDRFSGGTVASAYDSGLLTGILRRIAVLEQEGTA